VSQLDDLSSIDSIFQPISSRREMKITVTSPVVSPSVVVSPKAFTANHKHFTFDGENSDVILDLHDLKLPKSPFIQQAKAKTQTPYESLYQFYKSSSNVNKSLENLPVESDKFAGHVVALEQSAKERIISKANAARAKLLRQEDEERTKQVK
jgi:hypothetical protein